MVKLAEKYIGKPARVCPSCGSNQVWLPVTGGMRCSVCKPSKRDSETVIVAIKTGAGFRWSTPSDFDVEEVVNEIQKPKEFWHTKISISHTRDVFVSTRLEMFCHPISSLREYSDEETNQVFRKLDDRYFAWLVSRIQGLQGDQRIEAVRLACEIVIEGVAAGVLSPGLMNQSNWPNHIPSWYEGPVSVAEQSEMLGF